MQWTKNGYGALGAIEITAIVLACFALLIGLAAIASVATGLLIFFIIIAALAALFCIGTTVFALLGTRQRYFDEYKGCNGDFDGFLSVWNAVDNYMYAADSLFCGEACPCYLNETTSSYYSSNSSTAPYFNMWTISNNSASPIRFQDCPDEILGQAKAEYFITNAYFNNTFEPNKFFNYFSNIEKKFKCTGFCGVNYFNGKTGTNQKIVKYLFSDISKEGIPEHFGCFPFIIGWLRETLNAIAALGIILFIILIILIIIAIILLIGNGSKEEEEGVEVDEEEKKPKEKEYKDPLKDYLKPVVSDNQPLREPEKEERVERQEEPRPGDKSSEVVMNTSFRPGEEQLKEDKIMFVPAGSKQ
ncbi:MAG: hypothetical protein MJ252_03430 [archaeon]|nr:hypothetical protein [archaeon]